MSWYDETFYQEPTEFEFMMDSLKKKLADSIKKETQEELARLRNENKELQDKFANLEQLERDATAARNKAQQLADQAEREGLRIFKQKKFSELIRELTDPKFTVQRRSVQGEKCGDCDEDRKITFLSPQGRQQIARCQCADVTYTYQVQEEYVVEIQKSRRPNQETYNLWYEVRPADSYEDYMRSSRWLLKPSDLTEEQVMNKHYEVGFDSRAEAQQLADRLIAKENMNG